MKIITRKKKGSEHFCLFLRQKENKMELLHRDPFLCISQYISPLNLINLLKVCRRFYLLISQNQEFWQWVWGVQFSTFPLNKKDIRKSFY